MRQVDLDFKSRACRVLCCVLPNSYFLEMECALIDHYNWVLSLTKPYYSSLLCDGCWKIYSVFIYRIHSIGIMGMNNPSHSVQ